MAELGAVSVRIGADTSGLDSGVKRARSQLKQLGSEARQGATTLAKYGAAATAAGIAVSAALVKRSIEATDSLAKMSQRLGVATEDLQGLRRAAQLTGVQTASLDMGLQRMVRRVSEAAKGTGEAQDAIKELGLEAKSLAQLSPDEQFRRIAGAMQGVSSQSDRVRLAFKLFDSEGVALVNTLDLGEQGLDRINSQMSRLGVELSTVDAAQMEAANDAFADMSFLADSLIQQFSKEMSPVITGVAQEIMSVAEASGGLDQVASTAFDNILSGMGFVMDAAEGAKRVFEVFGKTLASLFIEAKVWVFEFADALVNEPVQGVNAIIEALNKLPGVDLPDISFTETGEEIREGIRRTRMELGEAQRDIKATLLEPLPSKTFDEFVRNAKIRSKEAADALVKTRDQMQAAMGVGGGDGEETEEEEKERQKQEARLNAIRGALNQEFAIRQEHRERMKELEMLRQEGILTSEQEFQQLRLESQKRMNDQLVALEKEKYSGLEGLAKKHWGAEQSIAIGALQGIASTLSGENKKMFEANKAFGIADALISTYQGIASALKLPFPANIAAAAQTAAVGFQQVSAIKSQSFGGGGGGGGSGSVGGAAAAGGGGQPQQTVERVQEISITGFNPDQLVSGSAVDGIIDAINERSRDGKVVLARG